MKIISTKMHGVLDYLVGIVLIAAPWIFGFANGGAEQWIPIILGAGALVYSLMTDYELGMWRTLSMKTHLNIDMMSGVLLAASPWILGFSDRVSTPHLVFGLLEIGVAMMTKTVSESAGYRHKTMRHSHA